MSEGEGHCSLVSNNFKAMFPWGPSCLRPRTLSMVSMLVKLWRRLCVVRGLAKHQSLLTCGEAFVDVRGFAKH